MFVMVTTQERKMGSSNFYPHLIVSSFLLFTFLPNVVHGSKKCYIIYLGAHSHGPTPTSIDLEAATYSHHDLLASVLGSHEKAKEAIIYSYNRHINGFAALLEEEEASHLAKKPKVVSVFLSKEHKLHTTRSWEFLGLHRNGGQNSAWQKGRFGENTIIANIDTGVWPESKSFSDTGYGPVPSKWRGGNVCQINKLRGTDKNPCNRKLIGARLFSSAFEAYYGSLHPSQYTSRDFVGHGIHSLSIAGGNFVPGASMFDNGNGTAKGGSPRARVAAYKVCWSLTDPASCFGADVLAAIDQAISDGVDIISLSAGGGYLVTAEDIFTDEVSIGAFHALARNIVFVASAGNDGPTPATVVNVAPWVFTVAASTIDRDFSSTLTFGNNQQIMGASLFVNLPPNQAFALILAIDGKLANATDRDAELCRPGTLDPRKVRGKIVACLREGKIKSVGEGQEALTAGAKGMLLGNQKQNGRTLLSEPHVLSTVGYVPPNPGPRPGGYQGGYKPPAYTPKPPEGGYVPDHPGPYVGGGRPGVRSPPRQPPRDYQGSYEPTTYRLMKPPEGGYVPDHPGPYVGRGPPGVRSPPRQPPGGYVPPHHATNPTINSATTVKLSSAETYLGRKPAPVMASFSSRGPNKIQPSILKPDITAPGVNILASYSLFTSASDLLSDSRRGFPFNVLQGTSMSCPHVAGIVGLLKTLHPNWSPAAIKSTIMTTATTQDNTNRPIRDAFDKKLATPFAYGSGHVQPDLAMDPGLVYDIDLTDYLNFLCASGYDQQLIFALNFNKTFICKGIHSVTDLNYPSITLPNLGLGEVKVTRTVTNVGTPSTYIASAKLDGYNVTVVPNSLTFKKIGEKKTFHVIVQAPSVIRRRVYQFGELLWTNGKYRVRSPITVRRK